MKIYFCGSIRGGRQYAALYTRMIDYMQQYGTVLTAHVGDPNLTEAGDDGTNEEIYTRDTDWLREADIVIAECSQPSLGVGYEIAYAEALGKEVHIFHTSAHLSAMLTGDRNLHIHPYSSEDEIYPALQKLLLSGSAFMRKQ